MGKNLIGGFYEVRAFRSVVEEIYHEGGPIQGKPLIKACVGAIIKNPFAGRYVEDLSSLTDASASLGTELGRRAVALLGGAKVEGYGKGGIAGVMGDQDHVVACITTVFGDAFRDAVGGGKAWISSVTKTAAPGTPLDIPLAFKDEVYVRSHYDAVTFHVPDGPKPDELLICIAVSTGGRIHQRSGGMSVLEYQSLQS